MNYYYGYHMVRPAPFMGFGWIFGIIFWVLIFLLIVGLVRWYLKDNGSDEEDDDEESSNRALDILKERYAKGEISSREFEKMKKEIAQ